MKILAFCLPFLLCLDAFSSDLPSRQNVIDVLAKNEHIRDVRNVELLAAQMRVENTSLQLNSKCTFLIKSDDQKDFYEQIKTVSNNPEAISNDNCDLSGINDEIERNRWNFSFHFGFTRTHYKPSDMRLTSSRMDVLIHDFEFQERTSAGFYNPANWEQFQDAFRWIDEPTNSFILTAEKNGHSIILSVFHPKYLKQENQNANVVGTIDGVDVDGFIDLNEKFDGYNNIPGEMYLVRFQNTHLQMEYSIGYGYDLKIIDSEKYGSLSLRPEVFLGIMTGGNLTVYNKPGKYWEYDHFKQPLEVQGIMYSGGLRVNYEIKNFNFFVEGKASIAHLNHGFMDGRASYNLEYQSLTFGVGYTFKKRKKKKKKPLFD